MSGSPRSDGGKSAGAPPPAGVTKVGLSDLPRDELLCYGRELGLKLDGDTPQGELVRRVRERQELLVQIDRDALLDIVMWARIPMRRSAAKEHLAREIARIGRMDFDGLSPRGVRALAQLRGLSVAPDESPEAVARRMKKSETMREWLDRKRRGVVSSMLTRYLGVEAEPEGEYQFLPEDGATRPTSLKKDIEEHGLVSGLAQRLRGAADDYVRTKLDEIEVRIDRKLDEIDRRLSEWRDREVANRLKIIRITLTASVLVAALSLVYKYTVSQVIEPEAPAATASAPAEAGE
ncbi:MAG: hypothetical protein HUU22_13800 [Phycisphaerae bacterium]|nr:hypothetical protein [Phycisphaerae bacterium]NUQ47094.1 hypothetical protein [Phycisphaerae bacterium]